MQRFGRSCFHRMPRFVFACAAALVGSPATHAADRPEPDQQVVYKTIDDVQLRLHVFAPEPKEPASGTQRPAIVFFFGGGWTSGTPQQFFPQCAHLAKRGMVAMAADYRVRSRHGVSPTSCVEDAKDAVAFIRKHAKRFHIDPQRIAAGGGSAGGHLAAATATVTGVGDDPPASRPNALVLFNPALVLANIPGTYEIRQRPLKSLADRIGGDPQSISPYHHLKATLPPTIVFHGTADSTVPHQTAVLFVEAAQGLGADCTLASYEGAGHGFFNAGRDGNRPYQQTVAQMDAFFDRLGWTESDGR